jgi:predicted ATPase
MVGRAESVRTIAADLIADRFVTIVGPGGMGKTTVAVAVAHTMLEEFADAVCYVELSVVSDPALVAATVASTLGLTIQTGDVVPTLLECLRTLRILLVLDNCEHVIDATATLAELTFRETAGVHILATSREALRVEGEHAYWLPPLPSPPPESSLKATEVLTYPAVELFMERAAASGGRFELSDQTAPIVAGICGRLDGVALAIEFAAGRVGSHGISGTEELLNGNLGLDWHGRRTALPRHQTLRALLDWSYGHLTEAERIVLQRLTVFVGDFSLEAAQAVAGTGAGYGALTKVRVADAVDSLVAKSLLTSIVEEGSPVRYRVLETTRVYAAEKLQESAEASEVAARHARYYVRLFSGRFAEGIEPGSGGGARVSAQSLGNVRTALGWCFSGADVAAKVRMGVELAAACAPVFLELSLLNECHIWSKAALASIDECSRGSKSELVLQEALAISSSWIRGSGDDVRAALLRGLTLAEELGENSCRLRLLVGMHVYLLRMGAFQASLAIAERLQTLAHGAADASYEIVADWMRGSSEHFLGNQTAALEHFEKGFSLAGPRNLQLFGLDYRVRALVTFSRVLWLKGSPARALAIAREAIQEAAIASKPLNVCFALLYTAPVFLWCGDWASARDGLEKLMAHPNWHALPSLRATGLALKGELLIELGITESGIALMTEALESMRADRQSILVARAACGLARGLLGTGRFDEARRVLDEGIAKAEDDGEMLELPELLRVKAMTLLSTSGRDSSGAEECLQRSLECARQQAARSLELRAALTLARFRASQGDRQQARQLLAPLYAHFTEGLETRDLKDTREFLQSLVEA